MKKSDSNQRLVGFYSKSLAVAMCCIAFGTTLSPAARAQNAESGKAPAPAPAVATSTAGPAVSVSSGPPIPTGPSIADAVRLYRAGDYEKSSSEYREVIAANPNSPVAYAGLARVFVKQAKLAEALAAANKSVELAPTNPLGHIALGEVYFRTGKISEAEAEFVPIIKSGQAYPRAYLGEARVSRASSFYKQAKRMIDVAHNLDPLDPDISSFWFTEQSLADRIKAIKDELADPANSDPKKKAELEESLAVLNDAESRHGSCQLVSNVSAIEIPFVMLLNDPNTYRAVGLKVDLNGTSANLLLDTGSTGILVGRRVAEKAGVTKVASTSISGIGDRGDQSGYVGHADSIRVGGLEFRDCYVEVSDKKTTVDDDGLLGADLFHHFLVDLDFSGRKFRLTELPARPDENPQASASDSKAAPQLHDRYIAPEMKSYTPVYRFGHSLLIPTRLNDQLTSLFLIDSGSTFNMMSPAAAREVTKVGSDSMTTIKGLNGNVKNVYRADQATLTFGHLKQQNQDITAFDTSSISNSVGTEVSGILGFSTLGLLDVKIDYRDGLVDFTFDSQKWCQGKCR
jgi:predicted aspartyl protease